MYNEKPPPGREAGWQVSVTMPQHVAFVGMDEIVERTVVELN